MFILNYNTNFFLQFLSYMARALSLGLRLTANMIDGVAFLLLIFLIISINLDLLYFDSIIIYSFIPTFKCYINNNENSSEKDLTITANIVYINSEIDKSKILKDNKNKAGIYGLIRNLVKDILVLP
jgi:hypothetical protein